MTDDKGPEDELQALRAEVAVWRQRAELAEALAAERLARAETAERALGATEAALRRLPADTVPVPAAAPGPGREGDTDPSEIGAPPRSLLDRWRRYTDSIS